MSCLVLGYGVHKLPPFVEQCCVIKMNSHFPAGRRHLCRECFGYVALHHKKTCVKVPDATFVFNCSFSVCILARPTLWDIEFANQLSTSINHQPRNGLEEMILWTKEGKLWQYPINNEDGDVTLNGFNST